MNCCPEIGTWQWLWSGAAGLAASLSQKRRAVREEIKRRRDVCRTCELRCGPARMDSLSVCRKCGCNIAAKTAVGDQRCCAGRW